MRGRRRRHGASTCPSKYGITPRADRRNQAAIRERGAAVGFAFGARPRVWNTFDAHRLLHWAGLQGTAARLKHALLKAYHGDGRNPGATTCCSNSRPRSGWTSTRRARCWRARRIADEVRAAEAFWQEAGTLGAIGRASSDRH